MSKENSMKKQKCKYSPLSDKEVLLTVGELLPSLISEEKIFQHGTSTMMHNEGVTLLAQKLLEKHLEKVPEQERFTTEASQFVNKYGDQKAAVHALVLLSDELNDFLSRYLLLLLLLNQLNKEI